MQPVRIQFATAIANEALKDPELITNFINIVADECSNAELFRIYQIFFQSKNLAKNNPNLKN